MGEFELAHKEKQSSGDKNAEKFRIWLDSKVPMDQKTGKKIYHRDTWTKLVNARTHNINRVELVAQSGVGDSALRQNHQIAGMLKDLENDLREAKILPELTDAGKEEKNAPKKYDQGASKRFIEAKRLKDLEEENQRLKAELKRFEELKDIMGELGIGVEL
jgi:hypothetical protein